MICYEVYAICRAFRPFSRVFEAPLERIINDTPLTANTNKNFYETEKPGDAGADMTIRETSLSKFGFELKVRETASFCEQHFV